jgi:hypothetical protein
MCSQRQSEFGVDSTVRVPCEFSLMPGCLRLNVCRRLAPTDITRYLVMLVHHISIVTAVNIDRQRFKLRVSSHCKSVKSEEIIIKVASIRDNFKANAVTELIWFCAHAIIRSRAGTDEKFIID